MRMVTWFVMTALALAVGGCNWKQMSAGGDDPSKPASAKPILPQPPKVPEGPTPAEQALELQQKLEKCQADLEQARKDKQGLITRNTELTSQSARATMELKQARKELDDANLMLREMKTELEKWKKDVLGFRQEMRDADAAQLDAIRRLMKFLGAEEPATSPAKPVAVPTTVPAKAPVK